MLLFVSYAYKTKWNDWGFAFAEVSAYREPENLEDLKDIHKYLKSADVIITEVSIINWKVLSKD